MLELFSAKKLKSANKEEDKLHISGSCGNNDGAKEIGNKSPHRTPRSLSVRSRIDLHWMMQSVQGITYLL